MTGEQGAMWQASPFTAEMAEMSLIQKLLFDRGLALEVSTEIRKADFYSARCRLVYQALVDLANEGRNEPIDLVDRLEAEGNLRAAGGMTWIAEMAEHAITAADWRRDVEIIRAAAWKRRARLAMQKNISRLSDTPEPADCLRLIEADIERLGDIEARGDEDRGADALIRMQDEYWATPPGIPLPQLGLSDAIPHYGPGHFWVLAGYTSFGKSTLANQLMCDILEAGGRVSMFSLEDSALEKTAAMMAWLTGIPKRRLLVGPPWSAERRGLIGQAKGRLRGWAVQVHDDAYTLEQIESRTRRDSRRHGVDVVFVDYAQLILGPGSLFERMSEAAAAFQRIAKENACTVVALSQVSNESARNGGVVIGVKGGGDLASAPGIVLEIQRPAEGEKGAVDLLVRKNRYFGSRGVLRMQFQAAWTQIRPISPFQEV